MSISAQTTQTAQLCRERIDSLTQGDLDELTQFAAGRLWRLKQSRDRAGDVVQNALQSVLLGLETEDQGRRPKQEQVVTREAFLDYLKNACCSKAEALARHETRNQFVGLDVVEELPVENGDHNDEEAEELKRQLFPRLKERASDRLMPTVEAWEEECLESDKVPQVTNRKHTWRVKQLAREILEESDTDKF